MERSKQRVAFLGVLSIAPAVIVILFLLSLIPIAFGDEPGAFFVVGLVLEVAGVITAWVMAILYAIEAFRNPRVDQDMRVAWLVLLIVLNVWAVPVYWYRHVRPTAVRG